MAAFVGGVEMALPHFTGDEGICPLLADQVGIVLGHNRWETFLEAKMLKINIFLEAPSERKPWSKHIARP